MTRAVILATLRRLGPSTALELQDATGISATTIRRYLVPPTVTLLTVEWTPTGRLDQTLHAHRGLLRLWAAGRVSVRDCPAIGGWQVTHGSARTVPGVRGTVATGRKAEVPADEVSKMRLLDLYCGAGGCAVGYHRAGFTEIVGVDIAPMPRYPFDFTRGDALAYVARYGGEFHAIHASPPCQGYSRMRNITGKEYPLMLEDVRAALRATGKPYVIENVEDAPLIDDIMLCGTMFGLKVFRHRRFESNVFMMAPPHISHRFFGKLCGQGRPPTPERQYMTITGNFSGQEAGRAAMGIDWMNRQELSQAIPPVYTEYVGRALIEHIQSKCCGEASGPLAGPLA